MTTLLPHCPCLENSQNIPRKSVFNPLTLLSSPVPAAGGGQETQHTAEHIGMLQGLLK